eukprot:1587212-Lingulodinium_polyedra.AAC.1
MIGGWHPRRGGAQRGEWAPPFRPFGPIGVLLLRLWRVGAAWPDIDTWVFPSAAPVSVRCGPPQW